MFTIQKVNVHYLEARLTCVLPVPVGEARELHGQNVGVGQHGEEQHRREGSGYQAARGPVVHQHRMRSPAVLVSSKRMYSREDGKSYKGTCN